MKLLTFSVALATVALAGCVQQPSGSYVAEKDLPCQPGAPRASVTVQGDTIVVSPKKICVKDKNVPLIWTMDSSVPAKYIFADDGIVISPNDGEFDDCVAGKNGRRAANGRAFICLDLNNKQGQTPPRFYTYIVKLATTDNSPPPTKLDPTIVND